MHGLLHERMASNSIAANADALEFVDFEPSLADRFRALNMEWLADFGVEPPDVAMFDDPYQNIVKKGGAILFARREGKVVATCALLAVHERPGHFELGKMAVTSSQRGLGVGRRLLTHAIARFKQLGGVDLHLETNSRLVPAIKLYESAGFKQVPRPDSASIYARADVYMIYVDPSEVESPC